MKMFYSKKVDRHKCARDALCFQADQYALLVHLKPTVNFGIEDLTHVGEGNNIPLDTMLEHCNNCLKDRI